MLNLQNFGFWNKREGWPREPAEHVFLGRAVFEIGEHLFPTSWTGAEPYTDVEPALEKRKEEYRAGVRQYERALKAKKSLADVGTVNAAAAAALYPIPPKPMSWEEWLSRQQTVDEARSLSLAAFERLSKVQQFIAEKAARGLLKTLLRKKEGGPLISLDAWYWNTEHLTDRFSRCQMRPDNPFVPDETDPGATIDHLLSSGLRPANQSRDRGLCWIFVTQESLAHICIRQPMRPAAGNETDPDGKVKPLGAKLQVAREAVLALGPDFRSLPPMRQVRDIITWMKKERRVPINEEHLRRNLSKILSDN